MSPDELLAEVLRLPRQDRVRVAEELFVSLEEPNEDVAAAWAGELKRRARDLTAGWVRTVPGRRFGRGSLTNSNSGGLSVSQAEVAIRSMRGQIEHAMFDLIAVQSER